MIERQQLTPDSTGKAIAYQQHSGTTPTVVFLHGFRSDMSGAKPTSLAQLCLDKSLAFLRFDLSGHGASGSNYSDFTIGDWLQDTLGMIDQRTAGPLVLVGSSLGGWLSLLAALERPERVKGLVLVAPAPDFPTRLILPAMDAATRARYEVDGFYTDPRETGFEQPSVFTRRFIEESARHNLLEENGRLERLTCPVRLLQGLRDDAVPWQQTINLMQRLTQADVSLTLFRQGDHRLNEKAQLTELGHRVLELTTGLVAQQG